MICFRNYYQENYMWITNIFFDKNLLFFVFFQIMVTNYPFKSPFLTAYYYHLSKISNVDMKSIHHRVNYLYYNVIKDLIIINTQIDVDVKILLVCKCNSGTLNYRLHYFILAVTVTCYLLVCHVDFFFIFIFNYL